MQGKNTLWDAVFIELNKSRKLSKIELNVVVQEREYAALLQWFESTLKRASMNGLNYQSYEQLVRSFVLKPDIFVVDTAIRGCASVKHIQRSKLSVYQYWE